MSIYSGFATRQQQQLYDVYIQRVLTLMQSLIEDLLDSAPPPERFSVSFTKLYQNIRKMEQYKYLKPKMSECLEPLHRLTVESHYLEPKVKLSDRSEITAVRFDMQPDRHSFATQKDLIQEYQAEASKRSESFRLRRPSTTKYSSKTRSTALKPKVGQRQTRGSGDEEIRSVVQQYLGGTINAGLAKAQKHYQQSYKRHHKQFGDMLNSSNVLK